MLLEALCDLGRRDETFEWRGLLLAAFYRVLAVIREEPPPPPGLPPEAARVTVRVYRVIASYL